MDRQIFVPFSEPLVETHGLGFGRLVPFQLEYECLRLAPGEDGEEVYAFVAREPERAEG